MHLWFIVLILLFQNQAQAPNIQEKARSPQSSESKSTQVSTISTSMGNSDKETPAHRAEETTTYDPRKDCLYRWYMRATIIGVLGGIGGVVVLLWQSTLLRRSVEATEKAARAASDNVNAFIATEASILYAEHVQFINNPRPYFRYSVGVAGKTNCRIFFEVAQLMVGNSQDVPPDTSFYENPKGGTLPVELVAIPGGALPAEFAGYLPDHREFETGEWITIRAGLEFMWACGLFRYRDAFKRIYERRFCYIWDPDPANPHFRAVRHSQYSRMVEITSHSAPGKSPVPLWRRAVDWWVAQVEAMKNGESKSE